VTSGEASHRLLRDRPDPWSQKLGDRMFYIGPERDLGLTTGLPLTTVADPADATFVLVTGPDHLAPVEDAGRYDPLLERCAAHNLPMICTNPDLEVLVGDQRVFCAGTLAVRYIELGGDARMLGKPDRVVYGPVLELLDLPKACVLAVGDALRTDIAGAAAAEVDSCWVLGGLHGAHLGEDRVAIAAEAAGAGLAPVAAIRHLVW
jgi:HAD superfamily hydrolase (TIGR01459 family)